MCTKIRSTGQASVKLSGKKISQIFGKGLFFCNFSNK